MRPCRYASIQINLIGLALVAVLAELASSEELLLQDEFGKGEPEKSAVTAGWILDNQRGKSQWILTKDETCRVHHAQKPYAQDSLRRNVQLPARYYLEFEARFQEHVGLSLVASAGRAGASFHGSGKVVLWKVLPNKKQGFGWQTVPRAVKAGEWHRFRILVDVDQKLQEFYIDDMARPAFREEGRDLRLQQPGQAPVHWIEFRDYGLVQNSVANEFRKVRLVALKPGERPPANSFQLREAEAFSGPAADQLWRRPGRTIGPIPDEPIVVGKKVELFLDDYLITSAENSVRHLIKPTPHPENPLLAGDRPWENGMLAFPSVRYVDGEFRMWYLATGLVQPSREGRVPYTDSGFICYATSTDGIHWTKPTLGHIEFRGSRENNIVMRHDGSHFDSFSVFHHPGQQYPFKMLAYQGRWPYREEAIKAKGYKFLIKEHGHFPYQSQDGIHWEYIQEEPEQVWGWDRSSVGYDPGRKKYLGFWKTSYKGVRSRKYAESDDLVNWTTARTSLTPEWIDNSDSSVDPAGTQFYGMYAFNYGSQYVGLLEILDDLTNRMHFQLISSRDLQKWNRMSAPERFINHGKQDSWNSGIMMMANTPPVLYDDNLWFYYDGADFDHSGGDRRGKTRQIGVSTLPENRFVALRPDDRSQEAVITTVPLQLSGTHVHVNASAENGVVQVEILDKNGDVIEGMDRQQCKGLVASNALDFAVTFEGGQSLPKSPVRLRFVLFEAELYAFWVE